MAHNRKLVLGAASLTIAKSNRHDIVVGTEVRDELEQVMISTHFLDNAPFKWIGLMLRYGLKNDVAPHYQGIDNSDGELAVAIELDTHELQHATREELKEIFVIATLKTLVHIARKYNLPGERFSDMLKECQVNGM